MCAPLERLVGMFWVQPALRNVSLLNKLMEIWLIQPYCADVYSFLNSPFNLWKSIQGFCHLTSTNDFFLPEQPWRKQAAFIELSVTIMIQ